MFQFRKSYLALNFYRNLRITRHLVLITHHAVVIMKESTVNKCADKESPKLKREQEIEGCGGGGGVGGGGGGFRGGGGVGKRCPELRT